MNVTQYAIIDVHKTFMNTVFSDTYNFTNNKLIYFDCEICADLRNTNTRDLLTGKSDQI